MTINREKFVKFGVLTAIFCVAFAACGMIFSGINQLRSATQMVNEEQLTELSHLLVRQQTKNFAPMLVKNAKSEEYSEQLDQFVKETLVLDANLYSTGGELIAQSVNALNIQESIEANQHKQQLSRQIVEPIYVGQNLVGFLRVTFNTGYNELAENKINQLFRLLYGEIFVLLMLGGLLASSAHYALQYRQPHNASLGIELSQSVAPKKQSRRFHSKRRAFGRK